MPPYNSPRSVTNTQDDSTPIPGSIALDLDNDPLAGRVNTLLGSQPKPSVLQPTGPKVAPIPTPMMDIPANDFIARPAITIPSMTLESSAPVHVNTPFVDLPKNDFIAPVQKIIEPKESILPHRQYDEMPSHIIESDHSAMIPKQYAQASMERPVVSSEAFNRPLEAKMVGENFLPKTPETPFSAMPKDFGFVPPVSTTPIAQGEKIFPLPTVTRKPHYARILNMMLLVLVLCASGVVGYSYLKDSLPLSGFAFFKGTDKNEIKQSEQVPVVATQAVNNTTVAMPAITTTSTMNDLVMQKENIIALRSALSYYKQIVGVYPKNLSDLTAPASDLRKLLKGRKIASTNIILKMADDEQIIGEIPTDVATNGSYEYAIKGKDYVLVYNTVLPKYVPGTYPFDVVKVNYVGARFVVVLETVQGKNTANSFALSLEADNQNRLDNDKDGLPNPVEDYMGSDKLKADTDGDGMNDGVELLNGNNPLGDTALVVTRK